MEYNIYNEERIVFQGNVNDCSKLKIGKLKLNSYLKLLIDEQERSVQSEDRTKAVQV